MRSFVGWLVWMLIMAIGIEDFQKGLGEMANGKDAVLSGFTLCLCFACFLIWRAMEWRYGKIIADRDSDIKTLKQTLEAEEKENQRKEAQIVELKERLKEVISTEVSPSENTIEPISVVAISDENDDGIKLLSGSSSLDTFSPQELKVKALQTANGIYKIVESVESNIPIGMPDIAAKIFLGIGSEPSVIPKRHPPILSSALKDYRDKYHDIAIELKSKIAGNNSQKYLSVKNYTNPDCVNDLKAIANDLRLLSDD